MDYKLILKQAAKATAKATLIFAALVTVVEELVFHNQTSEAARFLIDLILCPVEILRYEYRDVYAHPFYLLTLNTVLYGVLFAIVVCSVTILFLINTREK